MILDSAHNKKHVLEEMNLYASLVSPGSYLLVQDSNVNGHPVKPDYGPGPMEHWKNFWKRMKGLRLIAIVKDCFLQCIREVISSGYCSITEMRQG